jgi:hypothetical protein
MKKTLWVGLVAALLSWSIPSGSTPLEDPCKGRCLCPQSQEDLGGFTTTIACRYYEAVGGWVIIPGCCKQGEVATQECFDRLCYMKGPRFRFANRRGVDCDCEDSFTVIIQRPDGSPDGESTNSQFGVFTNWFEGMEASGPCQHVMGVSMWEVLQCGFQIEYAHTKYLCGGSCAPQP